VDEKTQRVLPTIAVGGKSSGRALDCLVPWFGGALGGGFAASVRTSVEGKIGADTAAWTRAFKAIRKIGGTGKRQFSEHACLDMVCRGCVQKRVDSDNC